MPGGEGRLHFGIANKKIGFLFGTPLNLHYRCLAAKVGCVSGLQTKKWLFVWHSAQLALPLPGGEGRLRFGIANKKIGFLFGTPLNLHYLCTDF